MAQTGHSPSYLGDERDGCQSTRKIDCKGAFLSHSVSGCHCRARLPPSLPCVKIVTKSSFTLTILTIHNCVPSGHQVFTTPCFLKSPLNQAASGSSVVVVVTFDVLDALLLFADLFLSTDQPGSAKPPCLSASLPSYEA